MDYGNFVIQLIEKAGMIPDAVLIGCIGAVVSIFYRINGLSWKESFSVLVSGGTLCGYMMPLIQDVTNIGQGVTSFFVFVIGFVSPEFFKALKNSAPSIFGVASAAFKKWLKKYIENGSNDNK